VTLEVPEGTWLWLQDFTRWIGTWCFYVGYRLRIWHRERVPATGPVVVVANHSAMVDGPLVYGLLGRRTAFLIKEEMFRGPLGWTPRRGRSGAAAHRCAATAS
jgi:1-acyl-sn-glycerol-3-phosphate acyltransferase